MNPSPSLDSLSRSSRGQVPVRRLPAWLVPLGIAAGFAVLFLALFRDRLLPAPRVEVALALATLSDVADAAPATSAAAPSEAGMLFQASGWIEPDPLPSKATSLIDGVVETVHVLEGQEVKKGDPLATLISEDARFALATAEQNHATLLATRDAHVAAIESARKKFAGAQAAAVSAETLRNEAIDRLARFKGMSARAIPEQDVVSAKLRVDREEAMKLVAESAAAEAEAEIARLELETRVRENEIRAAAIEVDKAKLALSRTSINSPIDGRVLRLIAAPGQKKMLQDNDMESSTIAILYDPKHLQVRVDVPLADAAGLQVGQAARIRCGLLPDKVFNGVVTRITGEADVQRNTLQAKVAISDPVDQLRPEMLCRAEFLATAGKGSNGVPAATGATAVWIPEAAADGDTAWVCDPESKRVSKRTVQVTNEKREGHVRLTDGLRPGEWVVLSPVKLNEGQRVNPTLKQP
ncbi:MAG: HlyD family efflux transporter periplasmic adaptor subunit [Verrucomicrobiaceae bacterium]|nr:MAG: HlyD family efflux transporter periplasmic adaptor subunit [Verrucomicrobiaceae bacterium]